MGATQFVDNTRAYSMREAYNQLVDDAISEYGHDSYNGTISTTQGYTDKTAEWKKSGLDFRSFMDKEIENTSKWGPAWGICIQEPKANKLKVKTQVEDIVVPGTKKWDLVYFVLDRHGNKINSSGHKTEAVKLARQYTEKTRLSTSVVMERVLVSCSPTVARIKFKFDKNEAPGQYYFFGYAAE
jgi:hypothetical protein